MKKQKKSLKKLSLNKETLVQLDRKHLQDIRGGKKTCTTSDGVAGFDTTCGTMAN